MAEYKLTIDNKRRIVCFLVLFLVYFFKNCLFSFASGGTDMIELPEVKLNKDFSLDEAIAKRRSVRDFKNKGLSAEQISKLLWAMQGITDKVKGLRSVPSAGALYPLEIYVIKNDGLFHYDAVNSTLKILDKKDLRKELSDYALGQLAVKGAAMDVIICAVSSRVTSRYKERGIRYVDMEAGHAAQNLNLMAVSLGLGSVCVGAFDDEGVISLLKLKEDTKPLYIIPVGYER